MDTFATIKNGRYLLSNGQPSHFLVTELQCRCGCGSKQMWQSTIDMIEMVRAKFNSPIDPSSGVRCVAYNKTREGAKPKSQHLPRDLNGAIVEASGTQVGASHAIDFVVREYAPSKVYRVCDRDATELGIIGLGQYPGFTHADTRVGSKKRYRW